MPPGGGMSPPGGKDKKGGDKGGDKGAPLLEFLLPRLQCKSLWIHALGSIGMPQHPCPLPQQQEAKVACGMFMCTSSGESL